MSLRSPAPVLQFGATSVVGRLERGPGVLCCARGARWRGCEWRTGISTARVSQRRTCRAQSSSLPVEEQLRPLRSEIPLAVASPSAEDGAVDGGTWGSLGEDGASDCADSLSATYVPSADEIGRRLESDRPPNGSASGGHVDEGYSLHEGVTGGVRSGSSDGGRTRRGRFSRERLARLAKAAVVPPTAVPAVEYYVPMVGDEVMGVVVSGDKDKLDVDVGAEQLGRLLSTDVSPCDVFRPDEEFWDPDGDGASSSEATPSSRVRFAGNGADVGRCLEGSGGAMMLEAGTVLTMQVVGATFRGRPILSVRKSSRRIAWHRVRQLRDQGEPLQVRCDEWDDDGLVCRIEGLRAALPTAQLASRPRDPTAVKDMVGEEKEVVITEASEEKGRLVVSEKRALARPGALVVGTVARMFPFGAEVALTGTTLLGMVHLSAVSRARVPDIRAVFSSGERLRAVVVPPTIPHRIELSTALLESEDGLLLRDRERVWREAAHMAARYAEELADEEEPACEPAFQDPVIANLDWMDFGEERGISGLGVPENSHQQTVE